MSAIFTDANFETEVLGSHKLTVIDFWAAWCPPCVAMGPAIDALSQVYEGKVNVGKMNVDEHPDTSIRYGITNIPVVLFMKDGKVVDKQVGAHPKVCWTKKFKSC
jgi:thioredoxin 1